MPPCVFAPLPHPQTHHCTRPPRPAPTQPNPNPAPLACPPAAAAEANPAANDDSAKLTLEDVYELLQSSRGEQQAALQARLEREEAEAEGAGGNYRDDD